MPLQCFNFILFRDCTLQYNFFNDAYRDFNVRIHRFSFIRLTLVTIAVNKNSQNGMHQIKRVVSRKRSRCTGFARILTNTVRRFELFLSDSVSRFRGFFFSYICLYWKCQPLQSTQINRGGFREFFIRRICNGEDFFVDMFDKNIFHSI